MLSTVLAMEDDDQAPIDPSGPDLVYVTVADRIERRIRAGEFGEAGRLPSEIALAEWYGVARMTIRRAHAELTERGLVRVVPGKGTFVTARGELGTRTPPRSAVTGAFNVWRSHGGCQTGPQDRPPWLRPGRSDGR